MPKEEHKNTLAVLDARGTLIGFSESGNGPEVPCDCDLKIGKYRWNANQERFEPIPKTEKDVDIDEVSLAIRAIHQGFVSIEERQPGTFNDLTRNWIKHYMQTLDAQGVKNGD